MHKKSKKYNLIICNINRFSCTNIRAATPWIKNIILLSQILKVEIVNKVWQGCNHFS